MDSSSITIPLAFFAGLLSFVSPCVLPLVPVYLSYLSGSTITDEDESDRQQRLHVFLHALCFVTGFTLIFTLLFGLPTTYAGNFLFEYNQLISQIGGGILIIFGLHTVGIIQLGFLNFTKQLQLTHSESPGYLRSLAIGVVFAAGWTPCIGPLLGAVMTMALNQPGEGLSFTFAYAMGLAVPFLLSALLLTRATRFLRKMNRHAHVVQRVVGIFLIGIGVLLILGEFSRLNAFFIQFTPDWLVSHM